MFLSSFKLYIKSSDIVKYLYIIYKVKRNASLKVFLLGNDDFMNVPHVFLKVCLLSERPGTQVAFERFRAGVNHRVNGQITGRREYFAAYLAAVAFLAITLRIAATATTAAVVAVLVSAEISRTGILVTR